MQFIIRAISADHLVTQVTLDAVDETEARRQIAARGLFAAEIRRAGGEWSYFTTLRFKKRRWLSLVLFSQELLALLTAGLSIVEALEALLDKEANDGTHNVLTQLLAGLRDGKRLSRILAEQPDIFPPLYIGMIQAAEGTSNLPQSLTRFIDYQQRVDLVRNKVVSAMIYPLILLFVGSGVTLFLIGFVVPRFAEVYQGAGRNLPWLSQLLLDWGQFAGRHPKTLVAVLLTCIVAGGLSLRWLIIKGQIQRVLRHFPGAGERVHVYALSRLYLTLGMLLEGGIPIVAAMETVQAMVTPDIRIGLQAARESIQSGVMLSSAFEANRLTTPISLRMLRVGERSGNLGPMLTQSATFYDGEITRWIDRFTRAFEPLLMAAIGLVVGAIVVLLYMPIFDLAGSLS